MNDTKKEQAVSAFLAMYTPEHYRDGDITVQIAAQTWNLGRVQASRKLDELVEDGKLTKVAGAVLPGGKSGCLYRIVETLPHD